MISASAGEVDGLAGLDRGDAEGRRQVRPADPRRPDQVQNLRPFDELKLGQRRHAAAVERRLEREVEALQRLDRGQPGRVQRHRDPAALA